MTLDVDLAARTITGLAVPYGRPARVAARRWRFLPGWHRTDGPVWLLRDHNNALRIGRAVGLADTPGGLLTALRVVPGRAGDRALHDAMSGFGLSVRADFDEIHPDPDDLAVRVVAAGLLIEITLTPHPAFGR